MFIAFYVRVVNVLLLMSSYLFRVSLRGSSQPALFGRFAKCREACVTQGFMCCSLVSLTSTQILGDVACFLFGSRGSFER